MTSPLTDMIARLESQMPWHLKLRLRIEKFTAWWRLVAIWHLSGIGGEIETDEEFCWKNETAIRIVRYGKHLGDLHYGEWAIGGTHQMLIEFTAPKCLSVQTWPAWTPSILIAAELSRLGA